MTGRSKQLTSVGAAIAALFGATAAQACGTPVAVCDRGMTAALHLIARGRPVPVLIDDAADPAVRSAAEAFASDMARVGGAAPAPVVTAPQGADAVVLVGVLGRSRLVDALVAAGRIPASDLAGKWEAYRQIVVERPFPGVARALVVVGSDRRGAVFGTYDLSERIGVSPWSWWADVPVRRRADLWVTAGQRSDAPKVRYRGIFINDEEPSFGTWARGRFGGVNARMYAHVFDLILRLKGNYLWPAMWGKAIGVDDPATMPLADRVGIVLGTSHHEPMTRAQQEWHVGKEGGVTGGQWDYRTNADNLRTFWRGGIERMMARGGGQGYEQLVTVGMRGDGDEPMAEGTAVNLLEGIVRDQREIIADVTRRPADKTPQVWALYKEVQDYYDKGMKVPDDVTLLFSDDNWGQVRRLPTRDLGRPGGYGIYYHLDYVGGPRSYKWINTNQVEKIWQQMDLSYRRGADALWVVNVGDLKPMELPIDFFMRMAWNPEAMTPQALARYPREWGIATFGPAAGPAVAALVTDYTQRTASRKPEFLSPDSYPLGGVTGAALDGSEFGAVVAGWEALNARMIAVRDRLPRESRDAFHQLVEYPIAAMTNLHQLYYATAWNRALGATGDARANVFADRAEAAFRHDAELAAAYHRIGGGKWNGMMLQTKIGYTSWRDPATEVLPALVRVPAEPGAARAVVFVRAGAVVPATAMVEAARFTAARSGAGLTWGVIRNLGHGEGAVGALPQGRPATTLNDDVRLDYRLALPRAGDAEVRLHMTPALNTDGGSGLRIGVSVDDLPARTLTMTLEVDRPDWERAVTNNVAVLTASFPGLAAGAHTVRIWRLDDNMLLQKVELRSDAPATGRSPRRPAAGKQRP